MTTATTTFGFTALQVEFLGAEGETLGFVWLDREVKNPQAARELALVSRELRALNDGSDWVGEALKAAFGA